MEMSTLIFPLFFFFDFVFLNSRRVSFWHHSSGSCLRLVTITTTLAATKYGHDMIASVDTQQTRRKLACKLPPDFQHCSQTRSIFTMPTAPQTKPSYRATPANVFYLTGTTVLLLTVFILSWFPSTDVPTQGMMSVHSVDKNAIVLLCASD